MAKSAIIPLAGAEILNDSNDCERCPFSFGLKMFFKEGKDRLLGALRLSASEAVTRAFKRDQLHFHATGLQAVAHPDGLLVGDIVVLGCREE